MAAVAAMALFVEEGEDDEEVDDEDPPTFNERLVFGFPPPLLEVEEEEDPDPFKRVGIPIPPNMSGVVSYLFLIMSSTRDMIEGLVFCK